jgi:hypothetical protein
MTLLSSKMYTSLEAEARPALTPWFTTIQGVDGIGLRTDGCALMNIGLGNLVYQQMMVVCDIVSDGILGQDFLLKYVNNVDYGRQALSTCDGDIPCWIGSKDSMLCRSEVKQPISTPAHSGVCVPVPLSNAGELSPMQCKVCSVKQNSSDEDSVDAIDDSTDPQETVSEVNETDLRSTDHEQEGKSTVTTAIVRVVTHGQASQQYCGSGDARSNAGESGTRDDGCDPTFSKRL